jgi:hypothetical protein
MALVIDCKTSLSMISKEVIVGIFHAEDTRKKERIQFQRWHTAGMATTLPRRHSGQRCFENMLSNHSYPENEIPETWLMDFWP